MRNSKCPAFWMALGEMNCLKLVKNHQEPIKNPWRSPRIHEDHQKSQKIPKNPQTPVGTKKPQLRTSKHDQEPQNTTGNPQKHPGIHGDPPGTPNPNQEPMEAPKNPQRPPGPHRTPTQWVTPKPFLPPEPPPKDPNSTQVSLNSTQVFLTFILKFFRAFLTPTCPFLRKVSWCV